MSVFEAAVAAMRGETDVFDRADAFIGRVQEAVDAADVPDELHEGTGADLAAELFGGESEGGTVHYFDHRASMNERLAQARALLREAERLAVEVLAEVP